MDGEHEYTLIADLQKNVNSFKIHSTALKYLIFIFLLFPFLGYAQVIETNVLDSIKSPLDNFKNTFLKLSLPDSMLSKLTLKKDSLMFIYRAQESLPKAEVKLESPLKNLPNVLDRLTLPRADTLLRGIKPVIDSLPAIDALRVEVKTPNGLAEIQTKVESAIGKGQTSINDKVSILRGNGVNDLHSSSLSIPDLSKSSLPSSLSSAKLPSAKAINLPKDALPTPSSLGDGKLLNTELPSLDISLTNIKHQSLPSVSNIDDVKDYASKIGEVSEKIEGVEEDIKDLSSGNLDKIKDAPGLLEKN